MHSVWSHGPTVDRTALATTPLYASWRREMARKGEKACRNEFMVSVRFVTESLTEQYKWSKRRVDHHGDTHSTLLQLCCATCNWCAAPWSHHTVICGNCTGCQCNESNSRSLSWSSSVSGDEPTYLLDDCQLIADINMRRLRSTDTAMCALGRSHNTFSDRCFATARLEHHACGTHHLLN